MTRSLPQSAYLGLKTATRALIQACGPLKMAAHYTRISSLSNIARFYSTSSDNEDRFIPVDVALDLMSATGDLTLLRTLAAQMGCHIVEAPARSGDAVHDAISQISDCGEVISTLAHAISDGKITKREVSDGDLIAKIDRVIESAHQLRAEIEPTVLTGIKAFTK